MAKIILVVEDYEDAREFMRIILENYGHEVIEAENGYQAVEIYKSNHPDLILMDMSMPVMDGLAATRAIRQLCDEEHIPIIGISAHGKHFYSRAIEAGCDDLIGKPINFDTLEPVLDEYLSRRSFMENRKA